MKQKPCSCVYDELAELCKNLKTGNTSNEIYELYIK